MFLEQLKSKYISQTVNVTKHLFDPNDTDRGFYFIVAGDDPTAVALSETCKSQGYALRFLMPNTNYTLEYNSGRINAHIERSWDDPEIWCVYDLTIG